MSFTQEQLKELADFVWNLKPGDEVTVHILNYYPRRTVARVTKTRIYLSVDGAAFSRKTGYSISGQQRYRGWLCWPHEGDDDGVPGRYRHARLIELGWTPPPGTRLPK